MKKTLIALAAVAVSSAAFAQATITGTFNVDVNSPVKGDTTIGMGDAVVNFGISEDLGGGVKASASTSLQTNAGRAGTVTNNGYRFALSGGFGTVALRNYLAGPAEVGAGISASSDMNHAIGGYSTRTRLQYDLPEMVKGLSVSLSHQKSTKGAPTGPVKLDLKAETINVYAQYSIGAGYVGVYFGEFFAEESTLYLGYNFGFANVDLALTNYDHTEYAVTVPLGANLSAGLHVQNGSGAKGYNVEATGARLTYALSKRTNMSFNYVDIAKSGAAPATVGTNYRVRVSHSF